MLICGFQAIQYLQYWYQEKFACRNVSQIQQRCNTPIDPHEPFFPLDPQTFLAIGYSSPKMKTKEIICH